MPETKEINNQKKQIGFWELFRKFRSQVIYHWVVTTVRTIIWFFLFTTIVNLFEQKGEISDYGVLLPQLIRKITGNFTLSKEGFIIFGIFLVSFYAFFNYFDTLWEEKLKVNGSYYTQNLILNKFRSLKFEGKEQRKNEISTLIQKDVVDFAWIWEHLSNHIFHSILFVFLILIEKWNEFKEGMNGKALFFSFFWFLLINFLVYLFNRLMVRHERRWKKEITKEHEIIAKETNQAILIDSMGLLQKYEKRQLQKSKQNRKLRFYLDYHRSLGKIIPDSFLIEIFPFLLLLLNPGPIGTTLIVLWEVFQHSSEVFKCLWEYGDYKSSLIRINSFLSLPEKDDNLSGIVLEEKEMIKIITFKNVSFKYENNKDLVLKNYTYSFTKREINRLLGENGFGKSTILYLILGMIQPQQGEVLISCENGKVYNLHHEINLRHWRENIVAYVSHDNLIEEGSTGQKQLKNINELLTNKNQAQIFLFDEADNALDQEKQKDFETKLEKLSHNKLVIYTKH